MGNCALCPSKHRIPADTKPSPPRTLENKSGLENTMARSAAQEDFDEVIQDVADLESNEAQPPLPTVAKPPTAKKSRRKLATNRNLPKLERTDAVPLLSPVPPSNLAERRNALYPGSIDGLSMGGVSRWASMASGGSMEKTNAAMQNSPTLFPSNAAGEEALGRLSDNDGAFGGTFDSVPPKEFPYSDNSALSSNGFQSMIYSQGSMKDFRFHPTGRAVTNTQRPVPLSRFAAVQGASLLTDAGGLPEDGRLLRLLADGNFPTRPLPSFKPRANGKSNAVAGASTQGNAMPPPVLPPIPHLLPIYGGPARGSQYYNRPSRDRHRRVYQGFVSIVTAQEGVCGVDEDWGEEYNPKIVIESQADGKPVKRTSTTRFVTFDFKDPLGGN